MRLIFIRHAHAVGEFLQNEEEDFLRELTPKGIKRFESVLQLVEKINPQVDVIFSSPLVRALQTAELVYAIFPQADFELMADLDVLDDPLHLVEYISFLPVEGNYVFVGHEPHLSSVIAALLSLHPEHNFMELKKGGICVLEGGFWDGFYLKLLLAPKISELLIR